MSSFSDVLNHEMNAMMMTYIEDTDRWITMFMTPGNRARYYEEKKWWAEHPNEQKACHGINCFARAQRAEFTLRYCRWATEHREAVGWFKLVALVPHNCDGYEEPEFVLTNLSAQQLGALESLAWPRYRYGTDHIGFADWLIRMRLADPPERAPLVVTYDV